MLNKRYMQPISMIDEVTTVSSFIGMDSGPADILYCDETLQPDDIIQSSRFKDLVVVDLSDKGAMQYRAIGNLTSLLIGSDCPVIITPGEAGCITEIVFVFDGTASSVFSIKQFTYLFPALASVPLQLLHANEPNEIQDVHSEEIVSWLQKHYACIQESVLSGNVKESLSVWLSAHKDAVLVMGTFGRRIMPWFFRYRTEELLQLNVPVFISNR